RPGGPCRARRAGAARAGRRAAGGRAPAHRVGAPLRLATHAGDGGVLELARLALSALIVGLAGCHDERPPRATAFPVPGQEGPRLTVEVLNASGKPGLARTGPRVLRPAGMDLLARANPERRGGALGGGSGGRPGCTGSRFTSAPGGRASSASSSACARESFFPPISTYSSVTRRRNCVSAWITSGSAYFFSIGISSCRSWAVGACNDRASRNCSGRLASWARLGRIPTVDTVMCRA